jgi:hypothetical protein
MLLFHRTSAAGLQGILRQGFKDGCGWRPPSGDVQQGVWLAARPPSDAPLDLDMMIMLEIDEELIASYKDEHRPGVWLIPANVINEQGTILNHWDSLPESGAWESPDPDQSRSVPRPFQPKED